MIKPTFRQGFPFLSLTPLEEKNCNWKVFKSCHAFVCLAFVYLVDWKSPRMRIWRIIPRIILPSNICQNFALHDVAKLVNSIESKAPFLQNGETMHGQYIYIVLI